MERIKTTGRLAPFQPELQVDAAPEVFRVPDKAMPWRIPLLVWSLVVSKGDLLERNFDRSKKPSQRDTKLRKTTVDVRMNEASPALNGFPHLLQGLFGDPRIGMRLRRLLPFSGQSTASLVSFDTRVLVKASRSAPKMLIGREKNRREPRERSLLLPA